MIEYNITVRHVRESHPSLRSSKPIPHEDVARKYFYEAEENGWDEIISITVNGDEFFSLTDTVFSRRKDND